MENKEQGSVDQEQITQEAIREHYRKVGRTGGLATKEKRGGAAYYSMIGKKGAEKRWKKKQ